MNWKTCCPTYIAISLFTLTGFVHGQPTALPDDFPVLVKEAPDSSAGFAMLQKKMAPLPAGAKPVKLIFKNGEWQHDYQMHNVTIPVYWAGGEEEKTSTMVSYTQSLTGSVKIMPPSGKRGFSINYDPAEQDYVVEEVDLTKELSALFSLLLSDDEEKKWEKRELQSKFGDLMLYATRLYGAGYVEQANQLAAYLFEQHSKRSTVLRALSTLADYEYMAALSTFQEKGDLETFLQSSKALIENHQTYWELAPQLQERVNIWQEQLDLGQDALPESAKKLLNESQKTLYNKLTGDPQTLNTLAEYMDSENWVLQPNSYLNEMMEYYMEDGEASPVLIEAMGVLKASRKDFFALVETMLSDKRLIPYENPYNDTHIQYSNGGEVPNLPEPMTVQQLAVTMLSGLAPGDEDWENEDPNDTLMMVQNYRSVTSEMDTVQLAKFYFDRRNEYNLPNEAVYTLLSSDDPSLRKETVQRMMINEDDMDDALGILLDFHKYHPEEAVDGLSKILEHIKGLDPENAWEFGGEEGIKAYTARLEKLLGQDSVTEEEAPEFTETLDAWIATGDPDNYAAMQAVLSSGQKLSDAKIQKILADRIQSHSLAVSRHLLNLQMMMVQSGGFAELQSMMNQDQDMMRYYVHPEKVPEDETVETVSGVTWDKEAWLPLLKAAETEDQKNKAFSIAFFIVDPVQDTTEKSEAFVTFSQLLGGGGNKADKLLIAWAIRYLEDPTDMSWINEVPDTGNVSAERKQEIRDVLAGEDLEKARALLTSDKLDERLVALTLPSEDQDLAANKALWKSLLEDQNRIVVINAPDPGTDVIFKGADNGDALTFDLINQILSRAQAEAKTGNQGIITIRTARFYQGASLHHNRDFLSGGYFRSPGIRVVGINQKVRISGEFALDSNITLLPPADGKPKKLSILELVEAGEDQQLDSLSAGIHTWLTTPVTPGDSLGQLTIIYSGEKEMEEEQ